MGLMLEPMCAGSLAGEYHVRAVEFCHGDWYRHSSFPDIVSGLLVETLARLDD